MVEKKNEGGQKRSGGEENGMGWRAGMRDMGMQLGLGLGGSDGSGSA